MDTISTGCKISFNNPSGYRHKSLLGYMLTAAGIPQETAKDFIQQNYKPLGDSLQGVTSLYNSKYQEPDFSIVTDFVKEFGGNKKLRVQYLRDVQNFFDAYQLEFDKEYNLTELGEISSNYLKDTKGEKFYLRIETVNPVSVPSERRYKIYPELPNLAATSETAMFVRAEKGKLYQEVNGVLPNKIENFVDINNPDVTNIIQKILEDERTSDFERTFFQKILPIINFYPDLKVQLFLEPAYTASGSKDEPGMLVKGVFEHETNTILILPFNINSSDEFKKVFLHELVHAVSVIAQANPKTDIERLFQKEFKEQYNKYLKLAKDKYKGDLSAKNLYGFTDEYEFTAELFSNPEFREVLKELDAKSNPFKVFINLIKRLFNIKNSGFIQEMDKLFDSYLIEVLDNQYINSNGKGLKLDPHRYEVSPKDLVDFQAKFSTPTEYKERLKSLLDINPLDWAKVFQESRNLKENVNLLYDAEKAYSEINPEDVKKSVESLYDFMYETSLYLRGLNNSLANMQENQIISSEELFRKAAHAKEIGVFFQNYMQEFNQIFKDRLNGTILQAPARNIKALADNLVDTFYNDATEEVAKKLAKTLSVQTEMLKPKIELEIARLEKQVEKAHQANNATLLKQAQNKLAEAKKSLNQIATPENLEKALKGQLKDVSRLGLYLESATLSGNLVAGAVGSFITNLTDSANAKAIKFEVDVKRVSIKLENYLRKKGTSATTGLDFGNVFSPFLVKKTVKEIKNNELVERESLFLISEMDEIAYQNDMTELKFKLRKLEATPVKTDDILNEIDRIEGQITQMELTHEERPYTDEYYALQDLLSPEAKEARTKILDQMRKIRISPFEGEQSDEQLDQLDALKRELDLLESDTDQYGVVKNAEGLAIAENIRNWKLEKKNANLFSFEITPEHREIFDSQLKRVTESYKKAEEEYENAKNSGVSPETLAYYESVYIKRKSEYETWVKNNTIRRIDPTFYEERRQILETITAIQKRYSMGRSALATDLWDEMFVLLKAYKNKDGYYEGSKIPTKDLDGKELERSIPIRIREIEDELAEIKESLSEQPNLSSEDYTALMNAYSKLNAIQERVNTPDYEQVLKDNKAKIRAIIIAENATKGVTLSSTLLEAAVEKRFKSSKWFQDNHRPIWKYNPKTGNSEKINQPLFFWTTSEPADKSLIKFTEPSFRWTTPKVNPAYLNTNAGSRNSKRVSLRKSNSIYKSAEYGKLDSEQKEILQEVTELYHQVQKGLPKNLKRGLELPAVEKEGLELSGKKFGTIGAQIKGSAMSLWDDMTFKKEDDKDTDDEGSVLNKANRRLYLRYSKPITSENIDKISVNFLNSIARYGTDVIRFKEAYEQLPYIYGIQDIADNKLGKTNVGKMVNNLLERHLNGQTTKTLSNNNVAKALEWTVAKGLSTSASMALSLSLPSSLKNFGAGSLNIATQFKTYGIELKDVHEAMLKNTKHVGDFFKSYVEDGIDSLYMQKVRYFNIMTENHLNDAGRNIFISKSKKWATQASTAFTFVRKFGEFEMRAAAAEALSKNYLIEQEDGTFLPILDCYDFVNNVITPKTTIKDKDNFEAIEQAYRGRLNSMNSLIHGAYSHMDRGEYTRYTFGRMLGYMKGWVTYQTLRRFGNRRIDYRGGTQYQGFYRTLGQAMRLFMGNRSLGATWELLSTEEKNEVIAAGLDSAAITVLMALSAALMSVVYSDDDDDEDHGLAYFALYNFLMLEDELSTLHPISGPAAMYYSRVVNNVNGKNALTFYFDKNIIQPFRSPFEAMRLLYSALNPFDDVDMFDEYIPRSRNGKILNPKQFPLNPALEGDYEVFARIKKLLRVDATWNYTIGNNPEYMYRTYEKNNERWFLSSLDSELKSNKRDINSIKKEIKSIERQIEYVSDEETILNLKDQIDELKEKKKEVEAENDALESYGNILDQD